jgi:hypothetical protein
MVMPLLVSAISGCVWGLVGFWLVSDTGMRDVAWAGLAASPAIGMLVGYGVTRFAALPYVEWAVISLVSLYVASALFGTAIGIADVMSTTGAHAAHGRGPLISIFASAIGIVTALTVSGWFLILWPASFVNHIVVWSQDRSSAAS